MVRKTKFYLDKRNGKLMGVCSGIADYMGVDTLWIRVGMVGLTLLGAGWLTIPGYVIVGLVADKKPRELYDVGPAEDAFWRSARTSPASTIRSVRGDFRDIDRRLQNVEVYLTSSSRNLASEIDRLR
ncbi:envelope stress response membrane protein PspC [Pedomonas mirosovicensis]|uniref:envelope stress response membrane protein PspC n=1 Tax=Pedomonas mirosovicensis TaxID=2908641 RepID=UPI00216824F7|nr:envelope stress response membrane protein PspC [Pedomonas mirosovicensis]MCH8686055.1 envelope stress response membrane protein PspC [Pedomonas mirosovicensis]